MALTKAQKQAQVDELVAKLKDAHSVMFSHYIGLNVADVSEFRNKLREQDAEMKVAKKTLMQIAFKQAGYPDVSPDDMEGAVACVFSYSDPLSGAQVAFKFAKDHDQVALMGGVFDGKVLTKEEAIELAKMPGREELLAKFVGMIKGPLNSFAGLCSSPLGGFARAMKEMADKGGFQEEDTKDAGDVEKKAAEETKETKDTKESEEEGAVTDDNQTDVAPEATGDAENEESSDSSASSDSSDSSSEAEAPKEAA